MIVRVESRDKGFFHFYDVSIEKKVKRRKIRSININLEIKMIWRRDYRGIFVLRIGYNSRGKIRSINYPPGYFIRSLSVRVESRDKGFFDEIFNFGFFSIFKIGY